MNPADKSEKLSIQEESVFSKTEHDCHLTKTTPIRKITVVPYDVKWADAFEQIKRELASVLENSVLAIEHVGSTAVPGLYAKPIIDIDIIIENEMFESVKGLLATIAYTHTGDQGIPGREAFKYEAKPHLMEHHLYVCGKEANELKRHLALRDFLRDNQAYREKYSRIKIEMAEKHPYDIESYLYGKQPVILDIYERCGLDTTYKNKMKEVYAVLTTDNAIALVIDFQERLMPAIHHSEELLKKTENFIKGCRLLEVPIITTQQYTKGLGETMPALKDALGASDCVEKITFSCYANTDFVNQLHASGRKNVIITGVEAHICVQQTVLDLLAHGFTVYVAADCIGSRCETDRVYAERRMEKAGAILSTMESILFELLKAANHPKRKEISNLIK